MNRIELNVQWTYRGANYAATYVHALDCEQAQLNVRSGIMYASTKVNPLTLECGDGQLSPDSKTKIRAAMGDWSSPSKTISYKGKSWQIRRGRDAEGLAEALYKAEELFALMNKLGIRLETSYESSEIEIRVDDVEFDYDGEALKYQCSTVIDETALRGL